MKNSPRSKVVQIAPSSDNEFIALCVDGSIWKYLSKIAPNQEEKRGIIRDVIYIWEQILPPYQTPKTEKEKNRMTNTQKQINFIKGKVSFKKWCQEMTRVAPIVAPMAYKNCDPVEICGAECWRDYFDNGFTPEDALLEDLSYA